MALPVYQGLPYWEVRTRRFSARALGREKVSGRNGCLADADEIEAEVGVIYVARLCWAKVALIRCLERSVRFTFRGQGSHGRFCRVLCGIVGSDDDQLRDVNPQPGEVYQLRGRQKPENEMARPDFLDAS